MIFNNLYQGLQAIEKQKNSQVENYCAQIYNLPDIIRNIF